MLKLLKQLNAKEIKLIFVSFFLIAIQIFLELKIPDYISDLTTLTQTEGSSLDALLWVGAQMIGLTLINVVVALVLAFLSAKIGSSFSARLRENIYYKVDSFSLNEMQTFSTESLITRSTNDVSVIQFYVILSLQFAIRAPLAAIWALYKMLDKGLIWTLSTGVQITIFAVVLLVLMLSVIPRFKKMQILVDKLNLVTRENIKGLRVVHAYQAQTYQEVKFDKANQDLINNHLYVSRTMSLIFPLIFFVMSAITLSIYYIGAGLIVQSAMGVRLEIFSNMVVFSSYATQVVISFTMLLFLFLNYPRVSVGINRVLEVLESQSSIKEGEKTKGEAGKEGEIEFRNVSFAYQDAEEQVLSDLSFHIKKGETLAIIGSTGSGKSTLMQLILRFFEVTKGEILVSGVPIKDYRFHTLREKIAYVSQKAFLFKGTIEENLAFGERANNRSFTQEEMEEAARLARAEDFILAKEGQYQAEVTQGATNFSGGQKQRLSIARAILRKPEIYLFDDSFSALDYKTEKEVRQALKKHSQGITSVIVAQRVASLMDADHILVLDEGRMAGFGKHRDLIKSCQVYREIALSQLSEEEVAKYENA